MKRTPIPFFKNKKDLFAFLVENKALLMEEKKFFPKYGDGIAFMNTFYDKALDEFKTYKANLPVDIGSKNELKVKVVINTTNLLDSHGDVHIPGIWKKSLSENKMLMHLREHQMAFDAIIADGKELKAYTETMSWKDLGYNFQGNTEALVFESTIKKSRNPYMFEQYASGYVKNHSVGMQYVSFVLCVNEAEDPYYGAEFEAWEKYFPLVANKEDALARGWFWAVKEAKAREGSAVPLGSNWATPTLENDMKSEPVIDHSRFAIEEPVKSTPIDYEYLLKNL